MRKFLVTAIFLPLLFLALPEAAPNAEARVNVNVNINVGGRISCRQGVRIVERRGFRNVRSRRLQRIDFRLFGPTERTKLFDKRKKPRRENCQHKKAVAA